jgi:hypothetical protein
MTVWPRSVHCAHTIFAHAEPKVSQTCESGDQCGESINILIWRSTTYLKWLVGRLTEGYHIRNNAGTYKREYPQAGPR